MTLLRTGKQLRTTNPLLAWASGDREIMSEGTFRRAIAIERKRTERSQKPFLLTLFEVSGVPRVESDTRVLDNIATCLLNCTRETDVIGWYTDAATVGVMFTDIVASDRSLFLGIILSKVSTTLRDELTAEAFARISISFHFFPDHWDHDHSGNPSNYSLYPDLLLFNPGKRSLLGIKRAMDIAGSGLLLTIFAPMFLVIAALIKASSPGPVLFRQQRVGQFGRQFTFLKFRSMHSDNDVSAHKAFVTEFICGTGRSEMSDKNGQPVYKLSNDKRVTRVGKFLRKTSLDELPQFLNVLKGEMSLVGPRPPIPYELTAYQTWHRRRILEVKPGITGLWQVMGRSRVKFDEMVRLDLRYAASWTPWLDAKILLRTPIAVIKGTGAY
jgi:lipopolysaccharide/colanic/teichoic acid biosynthesis glycosyltransferase